MASDAPLTTTTNSGSQTTTTGLQASVPANDISGGTPSSIQPGNDNGTLVSTSGIPLIQTPLSTVNIGAASSQSTTGVHQPARHINPVLLGFSVLLFVVGLILFWLTSRGAKNTTLK
jgi:hypothetical protein